MQHLDFVQRRVGKHALRCKMNRNALQRDGIVHNYLKMTVQGQLIYIVFLSILAVNCVSWANLQELYLRPAVTPLNRFFRQHNSLVRCCFWRIRPKLLI